MANPQSIISDAFEKLRRSISDEDAKIFASTELRDVWSAVQEIESVQRKQQSLQNLRRIEPILRGIESYAKVVEVLCNGIPFLPFIWAPIKLMLQLASPYRDVFEKLLAAYEEMGNALPRFDRCHKAFIEDIGLQSSLATIYRDILEFHQRAYKFFRRRAWPIIFQSLWKDFGSRFESIIESLKNQRDFVATQAALNDVVESKEARMRAQIDIQERNKRALEIIENNEKTKRILQLQHSIAWLSVDDSIQENELHRISRQRYDKTCHWISKEPRLKAWILDDTKHPLLWVNGKPGAGKSVMCSYIIEFISEASGLSPCYYFCSSQETGNLSTYILRTVALQLLRQHLELASLIANEFVYSGFNCGITQLKLIVPKLLEIVPYSRIIIDGLDECSIENQKAILRDLQSLCSTPDVRCKVLFSSRKEALIWEKLSKKPQISLDGKTEVGLDIRSYLKYNIEQLRTSDKVLLGRIESILAEKADGMFLWVRLVIDELRYCYSDGDLEGRAMSLPRGLTKAYERTLNRIMDDDRPPFARSLAVRILEWMVCSYRPLKIYEVLDGISLRPESTILGTAKTRKEALDLCRPLIEEGPSNTIDFVHFSAKEYLLEIGYGVEDEPFISVSDANYNICFSCVAYLNSSLALLPVNSTDQDRATSIVQGRHGLQLYANEFWFKHLVTYCSQGHPWLPTDLMIQLEQLLRFEKEHNFDIASKKEISANRNVELAVLNEIPALKRLVSKILDFRENLNQSNASETPPGDVSFNSCAKDPTHFSATRHHYQVMLERLLSDDGSYLLASTDRNHLRTFRETYGASAFVCRYLHCSRATDGFGSLQQRNAHEAAHQRKFRCGHPSCVYFNIGFVTRNTLNRHNEKYHNTVTNNGSISEAIKAQKHEKLSGTQPVNKPIEVPADIEKQQESSLEPQVQLRIDELINDPNSDLSGWQNTLLIQERTDLIFNIIGNLCFAYMHQPNQLTLNQVVEVAKELEKGSLLKSPNKAAYKMEIQFRLKQLLAQAMDSGAHSEPPNDEDTVQNKFKTQLLAAQAPALGSEQQQILQRVDSETPVGQSYIQICPTSTAASSGAITNDEIGIKIFIAIPEPQCRFLSNGYPNGYNLLNIKRSSHMKEKTSIQYEAPNRHLCMTFIQNKFLEYLGAWLKNNEHHEWVSNVPSRMALTPLTKISLGFKNRLFPVTFFPRKTFHTTSINYSTTSLQRPNSFISWYFLFNQNNLRDIKHHIEFAVRSNFLDNSTEYDNFQLRKGLSNVKNDIYSDNPAHFTYPGVHGNSRKRRYEAVNSILSPATQKVEPNFMDLFRRSRPSHNKETSRSPLAYPIDDAEEFGFDYKICLNLEVECQRLGVTLTNWSGDFGREPLIQVVKIFNKRYGQLLLDAPVDGGENSSTQVPASKSGSYQVLCSSSDNPAKRRRLTKDDDEGDDGGEDEGSQRRRPGRPISRNSSLNRRFACPFHKRSPESFRLENGFGACIRPGWTELAKLKEHLYRKHLHWLQCQRCRVPFASQNKLDEHAEALILCKPRSREPLDGMSIEAYLDIRKKKRCLLGHGEREKWIEIFQALFPQAIVPSCPYVDSDFEHNLDTADGGKNIPSMDTDSAVLNEFNMLDTALENSPFHTLQQQLPKNVTTITQEPPSTVSVPFHETQHARPDSAIKHLATTFSALEESFQDYSNIYIPFNMEEKWATDCSQPTNGFDVASLPHPWATYGNNHSKATALSSEFGSSSASKTFDDNSSMVTGFSSSGFGSSSASRAFDDNYSRTPALFSSEFGFGPTSSFPCSCLGQHYCKQPRPDLMASSSVATPQANDPTVAALLQTVQSLTRTVLALEKRFDAKEASSDPDQPP